MKFLHNMQSHGEDVEQFQEVFRRYYAYLEQIKAHMPSEAFAFARAEWHYNYTDPRCPHDSWLEHFTISEVSSGERSEIRHIEIHIQLLGAYHDGHIELTYKDVLGYSLTDSSDGREMPSCRHSHGDWYIDEVSLNECGHVVHEIHFAENAQWLIECKNIVYQWKPFTSNVVDKKA